VVRCTEGRGVHGRTLRPEHKENNGAGWPFSHYLHAITALIARGGILLASIRRRSRKSGNFDVTAITGQTRRHGAGAGGRCKDIMSPPAEGHPAPRSRPSPGFQIRLGDDVSLNTEAVMGLYAAQ
jgi:hypothetical protein